MAFKDLRKRKCETRKPRRRIILSCEGNITEIQYFRHFENMRKDICIKFVNNRRHRSAPNFVLDDLKKYLDAEPLMRDDEAWVVIDYDDRSHETIQSVIDGLHKIGKNAHLALSNPNFEFWLLLHFDKGAGVQTKTQCKTKLSTFIPIIVGIINESMYNMRFNGGCFGGRLWQTKSCILTTSNA